MSIKWWQFSGLIFTWIVGTLVHFLYEWSGDSAIVAAFCPVNESIWEHLKLLFTPIFIFSIIEYYVYGKENSSFAMARFLSILIGMLITVTVYYTYTGIFGKHMLVIDIITFAISALIAYYTSYRLMKKKRFSTPFWRCTGKVGIIVLLLMFIIFTFKPPHIPFFKDSTTGSYGRVTKNSK